jgi:hypothetical protein
MKKTYGMIIGLCFITILSSIIDTSARGWARGGGGFRGGGIHDNRGYYGWGVPYWYNDNTQVLSTGAFVTDLPFGYTRVLVDGSTYYYGSGYYLLPYSSGYLVVSEPVSAIAASPTVSAPAQSLGPSSEIQPVQPNAPSPDTTTVNIPNSKGGFTQVSLVKQNNGYVGPQGEFYAGIPTEDELKALYGN